MAEPADTEDAPEAPPLTEAPAPAPLFLQREPYRRRRVMDAARLLPVFGTALILLPVLWADGHSTAMGAVYLFSAWIGLIAATAFLSRKLSEPLRPRAGAPADEEGEP